MINTWMPIVANCILMAMGLLFILGGANIPSRTLGVVAFTVGVLSLVANLGWL